ncbi:MAG TPA: hypothetical protein VME46_12135 [Acidimicrobiales bacterium]|nr:hypothetical protein [Acidimicrobiales bacterium]
MYNPSTQYQMYRAERFLAMTPAQQRAADERAGEFAADMARLCRALVRAVTLAGPRDYWQRRSTSRRAPRPLATPVPSE